MAQHIIITGAGSGIGRATARLFIEEGWNVTLLGRREEALKETAGDSHNAFCLPCDVTDDAAVDTAFEQAIAHFGTLDALFNNAGQSLMSVLIDETSVADWKRVVDVNLTGAFLCARAAFRHMRTQEPQGGRIINNGSISASVPRPGSVAYTSTKHAISGLTKTLALDGRPFGIACGQIDIGNAVSDMANKMADGVPQADGSIKPEPLMPVEDVARSVLYMANLAPGSNVLNMTVMATNMPFVGRG